MAKTLSGGFAVLLLVGALTACGGGGGSAAQAPGQCNNDDPVRVGGIFDITGAVAEVSQQQVRGAELAVQQLNTGGGVLGRCVKLLVKDAAGDPTKASAAARELIDRDEVDTLIGPPNTATAGASAEVSSESGVLQLVGNTGPIDYQKYPNVFRMEFAVGQVGPGFVDIAKELGRTRIGILASNDAFGSSYPDLIRTAAAQQGLEIARTELFDPQTVDLLPQVRAVKDSGADILVVVATGQAGVSLFKARQELNWTAPVLAFSGVATPQIQKAVGPDALRDVYITLNYHDLLRPPGSDAPNGQKAQEFVTALKASLNQNPLAENIAYSSTGYDMVMMTAHLAAKAHSLELDALRNALYAAPFTGVKATYAASQDSHDLVSSEQLSFARAGTLQDGTLEQVTAG